MKRMRIRIGKDGKVQLDVEGAIGPGCHDFTKVFEQAVGDVVKVERKPEHDIVRHTLDEETHESGT